MQIQTSFALLRYRYVPIKTEVKNRVSDPDPDWIQIQSGQWIRIRIRNPDPDPGGQKLPTKVEKKL
jgi:hypothetical protein